jgi:N-acetylated-alpha-linked acidic dipeptidase
LKVETPGQAPGGVSGPVVYANYGRREDFELLAKMGVNVSGCIVLARYGKLFRGSKADNAHNAGARALVRAV